MAMPNFGITSLNELEAKLEELNLVLRKGKETQLL
jgi:DNA-directed RNA polymerase alpha subunit